MNTVRLQGRTALVTGASRNIGRAIALAFAAEGADLVLNTRVNREELEAVAAECRKAGVRVVTALADVADAAACEAMVARGLAELGAVDVLVCNAAIRPHKSITDTSVEEWHRVLGVNLHAAFYLARAIVPAMKARRRGSIIALGRDVEPYRAAEHRGGGRREDRAARPDPRPRGGTRACRRPREQGDARPHRHRAAARRVVSGVPPVAAGLARRAREDSATPARAARGHRRRLRVPGVRRVVLRDRRQHPRDGRPGHRLSEGQRSPSAVIR